MCVSTSNLSATRTLTHSTAPTSLHVVYVATPIRQAALTLHPRIKRKQLISGRTAFFSWRQVETKLLFSAHCIQLFHSSRQLSYYWAWTGYRDTVNSRAYIAGRRIGRIDTAENARSILCPVKIHSRTFEYKRRLYAQCSYRIFLARNISISDAHAYYM